MFNPMDHHEKMKIRSAAFRVTRLFPNVIGEVLSRELLTWEEFGYRIGGQGSVNRLTHYIMTASLPLPLQPPNTEDWEYHHDDDK